jgi:hypothetical protein
MLDLTKLNLRPASYYKEYVRLLEKEEFETFGGLPQNTQDAVFNFDYTLSRSNETHAILSANYFERFGGGSLCCYASPVPYMSNENQARFIYKCLEENKPWEYYYPKEAKFLEETEKPGNKIYY